MIFSRRSIQNFINTLQSAIPQATLAKLVGHLNKNDRASLDFEWEFAVLFALNQMGAIGYELSHGGTRHPDVSFSILGQGGIGFVADIATVSDRGLEDENPTRLFSDSLHKKAKALGISGGFDFSIKGEAEGKHYRDRKMRLAIPSRKHLPKFLEECIVPWLREIKAKGLKEAKLTTAHGLSITHRRESVTTSGSHPSYTVAYSLTRNPLYTSLKDKARQLRDSGFDGCKGIFLCDGNCNLLKSQMSGGMNYSDHHIIESFLQNNSSISFVITLYVEQEMNNFNHSIRRHLSMKLFINPDARCALPNNLINALLQFPELLPRPVNDSLNSSLRIEEGKYAEGQSNYGGSTVSIGKTSASIKISSRALLELLAGRVDSKKFEEDHGFALPSTGKGIINPFEALLRNGFVVENVAVERQSDIDDDWIIFNLHGPDASMMPFNIPK